MTRRKQNAPKHLKNTDKPGRNLTNQLSIDSSLVISDSGVEEGDEDDGETTSDEENTDDIHVNTSTSLPCVLEEESTSGECVDIVSKHNSHNEEHNNISDQKCHYRTQSTHLENDHKIRKLKASSIQEQVTSGVSHQTEKTQPSSSPGSKVTSQYRHSRKLSSSSVTQRSTLAGNSQMALVMSSLPLGILSKRKGSSSPLEPAVSYFSVPASGQQDDQPLDLSRKSERSASLSSPDERIIASRNCNSSESPMSLSTSLSNGFSSLQSLQQRFGGDYPLEFSQKSGLAVIPLQANMTNRLAVPSSDAAMHPGLGKLKSTQCSVSVEKQEVPRAAASSPSHKGESCRHASPTIDHDHEAEISSRHTIHRCSCKKSFSTLYSLSLHLQETGHAPSSSRMPSLMDYRKLVRGQDLWLNQESEQTRRILRCMQCGESFTSLPLLTVHMMQTQHYTKIVSSDHGRRSHKCSTYCDRDLDRECIFKCKVCQEVFSDMEGLASHMIISGHHKKQSSHQLHDSTTFLVEMSSTSRPGQRKRQHSDEITTTGGSGNSSFSVASLLEYRRKQTVNNTDVGNGFHSELKSTGDSKIVEMPSLRPVMCESCGRHVDSHDFDSHVWACLRQRAEVIDALKSKLAVEEAMLSRSESKLLLSGFSLSSVSGHPKDVFTNSESTKKEAFSYEHKENDFKKHLEKGFFEHSSHIKSEKPSPDRTCDHSHELRSTVKGSGSNDQTYDLKEVPMKKWYCSSDGSRQAAKEEISRNSCDENSAKVLGKMHHSSTNDSNYNPHKSIKKENVDPEVSEKINSISGNEAEAKEESSEASMTNDALSRMREQRLNPNIVQDSRRESLDITYSALHKLDMFSRGLKLSPLQRNMSPESKLPPHYSAKVPRKKESPSSSSRSQVSASPLLQVKAESPPLKTDVIFDIIDPNTDVMESTTSALEAMESFINKSFNAKSEICSSNLASMFSPFRNCFPLPGSLPGQSGFLPEASDQALSHFARFSRFFRMVPGVPLRPEITSGDPVNNVRAGVSNIRPEANKLGDTSTSSCDPHHGIPSDKITILSKKTTIREPAVKHPLDHPAVTSLVDYKTSDTNKKDIIPLSKKYKYSTASLTDSIHSHAIGHSHCKVSSLVSGMKNDLKHDSAGFSEAFLLTSCTSVDLLTAGLQGQGKNDLKLDLETVSSICREMNSNDVTKGENDVDVNEDGSDVNVTKNVNDVDATKYVSDVVVNKNARAVDISKNVIAFVTKNASDVDDSQNIMGVDVTKNITAVDVTNNIPAVDDTKNIPAVDVTKNIPAVDVTKNIPAVGVTKNIPAVDVTKNIPAVDVTKNIPAVDVTKNIPAVVTKNISPVDVTKNIPAVDVTKNISVFDVTKNITAVDVTKNITTVDVTKNITTVDVTKNITTVDVTKNITTVDVTENITAVDKDIFSVTHDYCDEENKDNKCSNIKVEVKYKSNKEKETGEDNNCPSHEQKLNSLEMLLHEVRWQSQTEVQQPDLNKKAVSDKEMLAISDLGEDSFKDEFIHKCDTFTKPESKYDIFRVSIAEDAASDPHTDSTSVVGNSVLSQCFQGNGTTDICGSFKLEANILANCQNSVSRKRTLCHKLAGADEGNSYHCDGDVDTDDEGVDDCPDGTRSSTFIRRSTDRKKYKIEEVEVKAEDITDVDSCGRYKLDDKGEKISRCKSKISEDVGKSDSDFCEDTYKVSPRQVMSPGVIHLETGQVDEDVADNVDIHGQGLNMPCDLEHYNQSKYRSEHFSKTALEDGEEVSKSSGCKNRSITIFEETLSPLNTSDCEQGRQMSTLQYVCRKVDSQNNIKFLPKCKTIFISDKLEKQKKKKKQSALDSLSSFVFNQPLTTEHPLDSLQKLLSTNDLTHLPADPEKHFAVTSYKCLTPELCTSQTLTLKGDLTNGGCSTDENEDDDPCLAGGGASEGDLREYKCAACNRRFASKGSYRYHLSRCHLSSVKKYGIKEAFNMSPYVYLPLDHTAKFSKYYQMAQELTNKEK